jgi:hypothetical protein
MKRLNAAHPLETQCKEERRVTRLSSFWLQRNQSTVPETTAVKSTRPSGRGPRRRVFVVGVERKATPRKANQGKPTLVSL